jgi:hypothetical protein
MGRIAQLGFDAQELVVFGNTVRAGRGTGLDLAHIERHGQVGDGAVFSFAGAVRSDGAPTITLASFHGLDSLGQRTDLVQFDEQGICGVFLDRAADTFRVGDEQVIAWSLSPSFSTIIFQDSQSS